jgi:hypothetical protein
MASGCVDFLERYYKNGDEVLKKLLLVTDNETGVLFVNVETKRAVKAVDSYKFINQAEQV